MDWVSVSRWRLATGRFDKSWIKTVFLLYIKSSNFIYGQGPTTEPFNCPTDFLSVTIVEQLEKFGAQKISFWGLSSPKSKIKRVEADNFRKSPRSEFPEILDIQKWLSGIQKTSRKALSRTKLFRVSSLSSREVSNENRIKFLIIAGRRCYLE